MTSLQLGHLGLTGVACWKKLRLEWKPASPAAAEEADQSAGCSAGQLEAWQGLESLQALNLTGNEMDGVLPPDWPLALPALQTLSLSACGISGQLPAGTPTLDLSRPLCSRCCRF